MTPLTPLLPIPVLPLGVLLGLFAVGQCMAQVELLSGNAGWAGTGLLGGVLYYLLFKMLPAREKAGAESLAGRDALIAKLLGEAGVERESERQRRHELANTFNKALAELALEHREDALKDREAFEHRNSRLVDAMERSSRENTSALKEQTKEITEALKAVRGVGKA